MKNIVLAAMLLAASPALAQQPPDPVAQQKVILALQDQRNRAMDDAAGLAARVLLLTEEIAKANEKIRELEAKKNDKPVK